MRSPWSQAPASASVLWPPDVSRVASRVRGAGREVRRAEACLALTVAAASHRPARCVRL